MPAIYFLWAAIVLVGFSLPQFAPALAGPFWLAAGIGGGLLSWWLGERDARRSGVMDVELGRRHGMHWILGGVAFVLSALPMVTGMVDPGMGGANFLLLDAMGNPLTDPFFRPDTLWSYEVGVKGSSQDGRLSYDLNAFYIDWEDYIISVSIGGVTVSGNADSAVKRFWASLITRSKVTAPCA